MWKQCLFHVCGFCIQLISRTWTHADIGITKTRLRKKNKNKTSVAFTCCHYQSCSEMRFIGHSLRRTYVTCFVRCLPIGLCGCFVLPLMQRGYFAIQSGRKICKMSQLFLKFLMKSHKTFILWVLCCRALNQKKSKNCIFIAEKLWYICHLQIQ